MYGADDFLPVLTYVIAQCDMLELDTEIEYMMELLDPSLLHGEGTRLMSVSEELDREVMGDRQGSWWGLHPLNLRWRLMECKINHFGTVGMVVYNCHLGIWEVGAARLGVQTSLSYTAKTWLKKHSQGNSFRVCV